MIVPEEDERELLTCGDRNSVGQIGSDDERLGYASRQDAEQATTTRNSPRTSVGDFEEINVCPSFMTLSSSQAAVISGLDL
jgi:hypothetical protein